MKTLVTLLVLLAFPVVADARLVLEVDREANELRVYNGDELINKYPVSVGESKSPTPSGSFSIRKVVWNPAWVPPPEKWAKGKSPKPPGHPENPMKRVKMFFKEPDYYIHGTGDTEKLGEPASHGCVRMSPGDVTELARLVMEHGGKPQPAPWYRRIFRSRSSKTVMLTNPIPVRIE